MQFISNPVVTFGALTLGTQKTMLAVAGNSRNFTIAADAGFLGASATQTETDRFNKIICLERPTFMRVYCPKPIVAGFLVRDV